MKTIGLTIAAATVWALGMALIPRAGWTSEAGGGAVGEPELKISALADPSPSPQRLAVVARLEFEQLGLQLVGLASFQDQTACFLKRAGSPVHMIYKVGDVIGGFRLAAIGDAEAVFERDGQTFRLAMIGTEAEAAVAADRDPLSHGEVLPDTSSEAPSPESSATVPALPAVARPEVKAADSGLKARTTRYATATVIEDAPALPREAAPRTARTEAAAPAPTRVAFRLPADGRLSSGFGYRQHPIGGSRLFHRGVDIAAPYGTEVRAAAAGVVKKVGSSLTLGRYIVIAHGAGFETTYAHLSSRLTTEGARVAAGERIGLVGSTGLSTGPHLHFEIHRNGVAVDPQAYLRIPR